MAVHLTPSRSRADDRYGRVSYWLESAGEDLSQRPALVDADDVDVAIVGGGYTGLWTAYYVLERDPSLRVAIVEREIVGFGASGRNGGWCSSGYPLSPAVLAERYGPEAARDLIRELQRCVDEVGRVAAAEGIDAGYLKSGMMRLARGHHQERSLDALLAGYASLGLAADYRRVDASEVADRVQVTGVVAGLHSPHCAVIHPGRLVRGLARAVERRGARIFEGSHVTRLHGSNGQHVVQAAAGQLTARALVVATEGYQPPSREWRRTVLPVHSTIVLTEPIAEEIWDEIGWSGRECLASFLQGVDYLQRTEDGRLLFGGRGAPYRLGSRVSGSLDHHARTERTLRERIGEWFPRLANVDIAHSWSGVVGVTRDWSPSVVFDRARGVGHAYGFGGQGVAASNLAGAALADLITQSSSPRTGLQMVGHRSPRWEPEPLRWIGVRFVQAGLRRLDERAARTGVAPKGTTLVERLARH